MESPRFYQQPKMNVQFNPYVTQSFYQPVHYPAIRVISIVLQIFAFLVLIAGLIGAKYIFKSDIDMWKLGIVILILAVTNALILFAIAELVKVFTDISISTRATLNQVIDANIRKAETENKQ